MTMLSFHNDPDIKAKYLARVMQHAAADEIIHGKYWEGGKGCAVGCSIHSANHARYETELGIPIMLARLEDRIFEGMSNGRSKQFPVQFLSAIRVGADLSLVGWKFLHWLLTEELVGRDDPRVSAVIKRCADVLVPLTKGEPVDKVEAHAAAYTAYAAYAAAAAAAAHAAAHAASGHSAYAAAAAAAYAAYTAYAAYAYTAYGGSVAADAAADTAAYTASYTADDAADDAAKSKSYEHMADKLLGLMGECEGIGMMV